MNDTPAQATAQKESPHKSNHWGSRALWGAIIAALLALLFFIGAAFLPRWWSHRIGDQVGGSQTSGVLIGLFYGFAFTAVALLVLWMAVRRKHRPWKLRVTLVVIAVLLSAPNLLTLGIVVGNGSAAHAGQRTLDVDAPNFRASTLIGVGAAVLLFLLFQWVLFSRRRNKDRISDLRGELKAREKSAKDAEPPAAS